MEFIIAAALVVVAYLTGKYAENSHYRRIKNREQRYLHIPVVNFKTLHDERTVKDSKLATGSVVISIDRFKQMLLAFRQIFGGEIQSYSSLIDRGRREALLRMKESVPGADIFLNLRIETSSISQGNQNNAVGCVEIVAYGTAISFEK